MHVFCTKFHCQVDWSRTTPLRQNIKCNPKQRAEGGVHKHHNLAGVYGKSSRCFETAWTNISTKASNQPRFHGAKTGNRGTEFPPLHCKCEAPHKKMECWNLMFASAWNGPHSFFMTCVYKVQVHLSVSISIVQSLFHWSKIKHLVLFGSIWYTWPANPEILAHQIFFWICSDAPPVPSTKTSKIHGLAQRWIHSSTPWAQSNGSPQNLIHVGSPFNDPPWN